VIATRDGAATSYGRVPDAYAEIARNLHRFREADIRGSADTDEVASIETIRVNGQSVQIMVGGNSEMKSTFFALLKKAWRIYVPLLLIALPAVFLVVPRIVRRALLGLNAVARKATEIDPRRLGSRLPTANVPREVTPLVRAFNEALERLDRQSRRRKRFLVDAAHELRTPIAIIQTRLEGMEDGEAQQRLLKDVSRLGALAEDLLDFERSDRDDLREAIDLVEIAKAVVADLAPIAIAEGYEISFHSDSDKLERRGNGSAMTRALGNLVRNAIEHGGGGGMISVSVSSEGDVVVADQGPGIAPEHREAVFEPFHRVTPRSTGAGLGLSLVRQIVTSHGGSVAIESSAQGASLRIRL
jgi:signal transduction histidine kinase